MGASIRRGGAAGGRGGRRWRGAKGPRRAHLAYRAAWRARGGRERVTEKRKTEQSILESRGAEDRLLGASPRRVCSRRTDAQTPCRKVLLPPSDATRTGIDPSLASTAALSAAWRGKGDSSQRGLVCEGQAIGSVAPGSSAPVSLNGFCAQPSLADLYIRCTNYHPVCLAAGKNLLDRIAPSEKYDGRPRGGCAW